jgi:hypothetical protein
VYSKAMRHAAAVHSAVKRIAAAAGFAGVDSAETELVTAEKIDGAVAAVVHSAATRLAAAGIAAGVDSAATRFAVAASFSAAAVAVVDDDDDLVP